MAPRRSLRRAAEYRRRGPSRDPYDVILIVCEGAKTEPNYFEGLRTRHRLSSVNVRIVHPPATDPMSLVNRAIEELDRDRELDRVYCVFDRDGHQNFEAAVRTAADCNHGRNGKLVVVASIPCFEIWILLHHRYTTAPFMSAGGRSACERLVREVQQHYGGYAKGRDGVFAELEGRLPQALDNARKLEAHNNASNSWNPSTRIHHLVRYLMELKR
jgi:hypothetical protein